MPPLTVISCLALLLLAASCAHGSWRMNAGLLADARVDPLMTPNSVSSHVHSIVGGNNFGVNYDYDSQANSQCSTIEIQSDKSAYWAPSVYYIRRDGTYQLLSSAYLVYYLHRGSNQKAFPPGFRMIAGTATKNTLSPGNAADEAINFHCLGGGDAETLEFPHQYCPKGVRVQILFPSCWDGVNPTSDNNKDHVSYPVDGKEGDQCPGSHPVRLMTVFLEHIVYMDGVDWYDGCLTLSNGDNVGWSSHADFQTGWSQSLLQRAIDECTDAGANLASCGVLMESQSKDASDACKPLQSMPLEDVGFYGSLSSLPGDNAIWGGGKTKSSVGASNIPPLVAPYSVVAPGWSLHGCIDEGDPYVNTMNGDHYEDSALIPKDCVDHCNSKGFSMAGLEGGNACFCANQLDYNGSTNIVPWSKCLDICSGSKYEFCGGGRNLVLYTKGGGGVDSIYPYPPAGSKLTKVYTADGAPVPNTINQGSGNSSSSPPVCPKRSRQSDLVRRRYLPRHKRGVRKHGNL